MKKIYLVAAAGALDLQDAVVHDGGQELAGFDDFHSDGGGGGTLFGHAQTYPTCRGGSCGFLRDVTGPQGSPA